MHDASHDDLCVLAHAGEAPAEAAAVVAACPGCRPLLEDLRRGSGWASRAAEAPPAALEARVLAGLGDRGPSWAAAPVLGRALALAALCAAAAVVMRWEPAGRHDDLDADLARVRSELDALAETVGRGHELSDLEDDIRVLQGDAAALRRQLGG
jgi:hypothetical protein